MKDFYEIRKFEDIFEFHNIMPIDNVPSVLSKGILSHDEAAKLDHESVALETVQILRDKTVPGGLKLHQYSNLYFHARNPMMRKRKNEKICVLRIKKSIIETTGIVFTDKNAASKYVRFLSIDQIKKLDYEKIFAKYWVLDGEAQELLWERRSKKCAEVLIPEVVLPEYIIGAYVKKEIDKKSLQELGFDRQIEVSAVMFFS